MKLLKRMAVCLLAAAMALSMLTACDDGGDAPAAIRSGLWRRPTGAMLSWGEAIGGIRTGP